MQTEEISSGELDNSAVNQDSYLDLEMTIKEDLEEHLLTGDSSPPTALLEELPTRQLGFQSDDEDTATTKLSSSQSDSETVGSPRLLEEDSSKSAGSPYTQQTSPTLSPPPQRGTRGRGRARRRSRWKLKFHHQALPPEYLDHYEASMAQQEAVTKACGNFKTETKTSRPGLSLAPKLIPLLGHQMSAPLSQATSTMDDLRLLPIQTLTIGSENETLASRLHGDIPRGGDDVSVIGIKMAENEGQHNKGLLGSLLANKQSSPSVDGGMARGNRADNKKRTTSVIMPSPHTSFTKGCSSRCATPVSKTMTTIPPTSSKVMKYQDLPYMGEMTLGNMKPRRGRKPKKADICHLIYKNYGTIFPGAPNRNAIAETEEFSKKKCQDMFAHHSSSPSFNNNNANAKVKMEMVSPGGLKCKPLESLKTSAPINHSDVQNRIISSLLEKRLTAASQEGRAGSNGLEVPGLERQDSSTWDCKKRPSTVPPCSDEPLNLCVKDLNQLKIRLLRKHGNFYEPRASSDVKSEPCSDVEEVESGRPRPDSVAILPPDLLGPDASPLPGGYVYWPSAGVFVHPMALQSQLLYYQKMRAIPLVPMSPVDTPQHFMPTPIPQPNFSTHINLPSNPQVPPLKISQPRDQPKLPSHVNNKAPIPKALSMMLNTNTSKSVMPTELTFPRMKRLAPLGQPPQAGTNPTTKRKRSAIFIPPMPSENNNNPTTEVSICKFKFTGGAKPSLQEKKMLSVDSGGNFRYYSGTGDKSMRGYEFFPRETLQQTQGAAGASSSEQFLAASALGSGEKMTSSPTSMSPATKDSPLATHFALEDTRINLQSYPDAASKCVTDLSQVSEDHFKNSDVKRTFLQHESLGGGQKKKTELMSKCGQVVGSGGDPENYSVMDVEDDQGPNSFRLRRKRKTRKSLAREKLEQTFKEKGFLIQTQQLESAEGATYCKFRQLRKFTRYLFRSWKDYLPGNVKEMSVAAGVGSSPPHEPGPSADSDLEEESSSGTHTPALQHSDSLQLPNTPP